MQKRSRTGEMMDLQTTSMEPPLNMRQLVPKPDEVEAIGPSTLVEESREPRLAEKEGGYEENELKEEEKELGKEVKVLRARKRRG